MPDQRRARVILAFIAVVVLTGSTPGPWETLESGPITFEYKEPDRKLANFLAAVALEHWPRLREDTGLREGLRVQVVIAPTAEAFMDEQPAGVKVPEWAAGVAHPGRNLVVLKSPRAIKGPQPHFEKIFIHELSHIALAGALHRSRIPKWLHEGFAIHEAGEWSIGREAVLTRAVLNRSIIPFDELMRSFPAGEGRARVAYAQSADLVGYLLGRFGSGSFSLFLEALGAGSSPYAASRAAFGLSLVAIEEDWVRHINRRYAWVWVPVVTSSLALWFAITLIFLAGYVRKRRQSKLRLEMWEIEEDLDRLRYHDDDDGPGWIQ